MDIRTALKGLVKSDELVAAFRGLWSIRVYDNEHWNISWKRFCLRKVLLSYLRDSFMYECTCDPSVQTECKGYVATLKKCLSDYDKDTISSIHDVLMKQFALERPFLESAAAEVSSPPAYEETLRQIAAVQKQPAEAEEHQTPEVVMGQVLYLLSLLTDEEVQEAFVLHKWKRLLRPSGV